MLKIIKKEIETHDNPQIKNFYIINTVHKVKNKTQIEEIFGAHVRC